MNKYIKFKKNIIVFTLGSLGTKIINIILLPYYTNVFSTSEYGIVELLLTIAGLIIPIISLSINDAVLRFSIDEIENRDVIFSSSIIITVIGFLVSLIPIFFIHHLVEIKFLVYLYVYILLTMIYNLFGYYAKGIGYTAIYAKSGILYTFIFSILNIFLISVCKLKIEGYFISLFIATLICIVYISIKCHYRFCILHRIDIEMIKKLLKFSIPLVPNNISWWVSNSSDKLLLNRYVSIADVGIYSVAYKIPNAYNSVTSIFINAWQISTVETLNDNDKFDFYKKIYNAYFYVSIMLTSIIAISARLISIILFENEFQIAWMCMPLLVASVFFSSIAAFYGGILTANKYTTSIFTSTVVCALTNITLNIIFIPKLKTVGAALATCLCYILLFVIRNMYIKHKIKYTSNNCMNYLSIFFLMMQVLLYIDYFHISVVCFVVLAIICIKVIRKSKILNVINYHYKDQ